MLSDLRYALRVLLRARGFTCAVVLVLALGIGSNSAIFSALDAIVIRPLPYPSPNRLATLWEDFSAFGVPKNRVSPATLLDWRKRTQVFEQIAAYSGPATLDLSGGGPPEEVLGLNVTANLLPMLGVPPLLGRTINKEEEIPNSHVVVLSYSLWQRRYQGNPNLPGRSIEMNGEKYLVAGIMPRGFQYPDRQTELWIPLGITPQLWAHRNSHFLKVVGRINPGRDLRQAQSDMTGIAAQLASEFPATNAKVGIAVVSLKDEILGDTRMAFLILLAAAGCVLLIACANVGNLLLARASGRRREIAVRTALGASPSRLLRQILTENLLLASAGGALGLLFAQWSLAGLKHMIPPGLGSLDLHLDLRVLAFTAAVSILTALLFGLAPALQLARTELSNRSAIGRGGKLRDVLVVAEVAIALMLVVGASLLIQTMAHLRAVDPGFHSAGILTAEINIPMSKYRDEPARRRFYDVVLERVRAIPGVKSAGLTSDLPYTSRGNYMSLAIEGNPAAKGLGIDALFRLVSADYLQTIGAHLLEGRFLDQRDRETSTPVVVVNETLARQYWPNESPLGHRLNTGTGNSSPIWMTIAGVVRDVRERGLDLSLKSAVYVPYPQAEITFFQPSEVAIQVARDPLSISIDLQHAVASVDPEQPVSHIRTMDAIVDDELANRTQVLNLLGTFAALALVLAALGIYGVLSYVVSQRTREIGLRIAIGASRWNIAKEILKYSARLTFAGLATGIVLAIAATRWLSTLLYGVSPLDPITFVGVSMTLVTVALVASFVPARRAVAVDPMAALRDE